MRRDGILAAAAVIVITNAIVLIEVARNRSGGPVETIQLTERELPMNVREKEDTGVAVSLNWRRFNFGAHEFSWLDRPKLEGLGFDYVRAMQDPLHRPLPRPAFVVLEYNGPAWEQWLNSAQQAKQFFGTQPEMYSRLFPVDVASTPEALLRTYPDRAKYLVVKGVVQLSVITRQGELQILPSISQLLPDSIHVSPPISDALANLPMLPNLASPRYTLTLSYGRRFEPWLVSVGEPGKN
jgi:hypothetical protein